VSNLLTWFMISRNMPQCAKHTQPLRYSDTAALSNVSWHVLMLKHMQKPHQCTCFCKCTCSGTVCTFGIYASQTCIHRSILCVHVCVRHRKLIASSMLLVVHMYQVLSHSGAHRVVTCITHELCNFYNCMQYSIYTAHFPLAFCSPESS
jgi:hypothetical protein